MISDEIRSILTRVPSRIAEAMDATGEEMVTSMKNRLTAGNHIDTGQLISSIHAETTANEDEIITDIYIDAKSNEGTWYAEFLEYGTGIYNENGNGRQTPWAWQDRNGDWHTTRGMRADPFIRPSVAEHVGELDENIDHILRNL